MSKTLHDRTLALAGVLQAVQLVQQVARHGSADEAATAACLDSLFVFSAESTEAVYGGAARLRDGLLALCEQLERGSQQRDLEVTRYAVGVLHLGRKLKNNRQRMEAIREGLLHAERQRLHYGSVHANMMAALADLYLNTISTLGPRILVAGEHGHLANPTNANRVRALLLAGIRSAVLYYQSGGNRLQLLFGRGAVVAEARRLLDDITPGTIGA